MVREIMKDVAFLSQKAEPATPEDLPIAADLLETLQRIKLGASAWLQICRRQPSGSSRLTMKGNTC